MRDKTEQRLQAKAWSGVFCKSIEVISSKNKSISERFSVKKFSITFANYINQVISLPHFKNIFRKIFRRKLPRTNYALIQ